jgi:hypothetical protein
MSYGEQIAGALAAVAVRGPTRFAWLGRLSPAVDAPLEAGMDERARRRHLLDNLGDRLYYSWYCPGGAVPDPPGRRGMFFADQAFVAALSDANTGRGTWQNGWTVERLDGDVAVSSDGTLRARVPVADCRAGDGGLRAGATVAVRLPKELPFYSPGSHMMVGDAGLQEGAEQVRVYWHLTPNGAPAFVHMLTSRLNGAEVPFQLKVASHPLAMTGGDAAVLYVPAARFGAVREDLAEIARATSAHRRPRIPALTLELAPGVGLAEGLRLAETFGSRRCALLAEAIVRAHEQGVTRPTARLAVVAGCFTEAGVAIDAPYLEPAMAGRHVL